MRSENHIQQLHIIQHRLYSCILYKAQLHSASQIPIHKTNKEPNKSINKSYCHCHILRLSVDGVFHSQDLMKGRRAVGWLTLSWSCVHHSDVPAIQAVHPPTPSQKQKQKRFRSIRDWCRFLEQATEQLNRSDNPDRRMSFHSLVHSLIPLLECFSALELVLRLCTYDQL